MNEVTIFFSIMNQTEFHLVHNQKENCKLSKKKTEKHEK